MRNITKAKRSPAFSGQGASLANENKQFHHAQTAMEREAAEKRGRCWSREILSTLKRLGFEENALVVAKILVPVLILPFRDRTQN
ncbi:MAG TPA: hypothetical protein VKZ51_00415 [Cyclobacteriaceae bacterium]|nr:hypothetical protein [Cyclobacteriaceae bacterium]